MADNITNKYREFSLMLIKDRIISSVYEDFFSQTGNDEKLLISYIRAALISITPQQLREFQKKSENKAALVRTINDYMLKKAQDKPDQMEKEIGDLRQKTVAVSQQIDPVLMELKKQFEERLVERDALIKKLERQIEEKNNMLQLKENQLSGEKNANEELRNKLRVNRTEDLVVSSNISATGGETESVASAEASVPQRTDATSRDEAYKKAQLGYFARKRYERELVKIKEKEVTEKREAKKAQKKAERAAEVNIFVKRFFSGNSKLSEDKQKFFAEWLRRPVPVGLLTQLAENDSTIEGMELCIETWLDANNFDEE